MDQGKLRIKKPIPIKEVINANYRYPFFIYYNQKLKDRFNYKIKYKIKYYIKVIII